MNDAEIPMPDEPPIDPWDASEAGAAEQRAWSAPASSNGSGEELPLTALLDTLEAISAQVKTEGARVDTVEETVAELASAVSKLLEQEKKKRKPRRYRFDTLNAAGQRELWGELADFVDYLNANFGTSTYSGEKQEWRIPEWWWRQPIVVFELLALKAAHDEAFTATTPNAPTTEMIAWVDRWFWPCYHRIFNEQWGLKASPAPDKIGTKFSVEDAVNDRADFDEFLAKEYGEVESEQKPVDSGGEVAAAGRTEQA